MGSLRRLLSAIAVPAAVAVCLASCIGPTRVEQRPYRLYAGAERPSQEIAVVRLEDAGFARFDGRLAARGDWTEVHLLPGRHLIEWVSSAPGGWDEDSSADPCDGQGRRVHFVLEAGHTYSLRRHAVDAIVDETTARIVPGDAECTR